MNKRKRILEEAISQQVSFLKLDGLGLEDEDFTRLVTHNPRLTKLELSCFGENWLSLLTILPNLTDLSLRFSLLSKEEVQSLFALKNLQHLKIVAPNDLSADFFSELINSDNLLSLEIIDCEFFRDKELEQISKLTHLTSLTLVRPRISDKGLIPLSSMKKLTSLKLIYPSIGNIGMKYLSALENLQELTLVSNHITHIGLRRLSSLKKLTKLRIDTAVREINNRVLQEIGQLTKLKELYLDGCSTVTQKGLEYLSPLKDLVKLEIKDAFKLTSIEPLSHFSNLEHLSLKGGYSLVDKGLAPLAKLSKLTFLDLRRCHITDQGIKNLQNLSYFEILNLCMSEISDPFGYFPSFTKLRELDISWCDLLTNKSFRHLVHHTHLHSINLGFCPQITDEALYHLSHIKNLSVLNLAECYLITDEGLKHLSQLEKLSVLNLFNCHQITDEGLRHLSNLDNLIDLDLYKCTNITPEGLSYLARLKRLRHVNLRLCRNIAPHNCLQWLPEVECEATRWREPKF